MTSCPSSRRSTAFRALNERDRRGGRLPPEDHFFVGDSTAPELMGWFDETYLAFHRRLRSVVAERAIHCPCPACVRAPTLTVEQLHGTDVIVPHRLAKNHVPSHEYVHATATLLDLLPAEQAASFIRVEEDVADLGVLAVGYRDFAPLRALRQS